MAQVTRNLDLHSPHIQTAGRVDVLAARVLKVVVDRVQDPAIKVLYAQFQPNLDGFIHRLLSPANCTNLLKQIGIAPSTPVISKPAKSTRRTVKQAKQARKPVKKSKSQATPDIIDAEVIDI